MAESVPAIGGKQVPGGVGNTSAAEAAAQVRVVRSATSPGPIASPGAHTFAVPDPARQASVKPRHKMLVASFFLVVVLPSVLASWYLWERAVDQYASHVAFSVRQAEAAPAMELLGGITQLSGASTSDAEVLYEYIRSENMVRAVLENIDLVQIWSRSGDPIFSLPQDSRIEAMHRYWRRMVRAFYDSGTGLIQVQVNAFDPADAQSIARSIYEESSRTINELTSIAQDDTTRYAREELDRSMGRLYEARAALTAFRNRTQIVDPQADALGWAGLLTTLQTQLAAALIDLDLVRSSSAPGDPRVIQAERRVEVIEERIQQERNAVSGSADDEGGYSALVGEYEGLSVDLRFAEQAYVAALASYDSALGEARRKSRYLAAHITPTLAETPLYPKRMMLLILLTGSTLLAWTLLAMGFYAFRDRR